MTSPRRSCVVHATTIIFASLLVSRAPCVGGSPATLTILASRSRAHSVAGYRMSSRCRCAVFIIASFTVRVTSAHGGTKPIYRSNANCAQILAGHAGCSP